MVFLEEKKWLKSTNLEKNFVKERRLKDKANETIPQIKRAGIVE